MDGRSLLKTGVGSLLGFLGIKRKPNQATPDVELGVWPSKHLTQATAVLPTGDLVDINLIENGNLPSGPDRLSRIKFLIKDELNWRGYTWNAPLLCLVNMPTSIEVFYLSPHKEL